MTNGRNVGDTILIWATNQMFCSSFVEVVQSIVGDIDVICIGQSRYPKGTGFGFIANMFNRVIGPLNNKVNEAIRSCFLGRVLGG